MNKRLEDLILAAQDWAEAGIPVFPVKEDKAPLTEHGFHDAVTDPAAVRALFEFYGDAAWGIGGSMGNGLFAVDVDLYKSADVKAWYDARLEDGSLTETRVHKTKSGGLHFIYEGSVQDCKPHAGVEVKSDGGYIVLPPSVGYSVEAEGVSQAPQRLLETLRYSAQSARGSTVAQLEANVLSGSDFHNSLTQLGAKKAAAGLTQIEVQKYLLELMNASSASQAGHERHARWRAIMADKGGELSRIASSANRKFNDTALHEEFSELEDISDLLDADNAVFIGPTDSPIDVPVVASDSWPWSAKEGAFAHSDFDLQDVEFNLHPLYVQNETVLVIANPKMGKTAFTLTSALHMACGMDLGSLKVHGPSAVLYYGLEGQHAIRLRIEAWKKTMRSRDIALPDSIPLFNLVKHTNFVKEGVRKTEAGKIIAAAKYAERLGSPLKAIFIDTLTKAMSGGDQNSVEDTSNLFELVSLIRDAGVTATIIFVHHEAKAGGARGSSNIEAEPDTVLRVTKKNDIVSVQVVLARSIEDGATYSYQIESVDLGQTKQGHPLGSFVLNPVDADLDAHDNNAAADIIHELVPRREAIVKLAMHSGEVSAGDIVNEWFKLGLIKGMSIRKQQTSPSLDMAHVKEALAKVVKPVGEPFGGYLIRSHIEGRAVTKFTIHQIG